MARTRKFQDEDIIQAIQEITEAKGEADTKTLASELGSNYVTVNKYLRELEQAGKIRSESCGRGGRRVWSVLDDDPEEQQDRMALAEAAAKAGVRVDLRVDTVVMPLEDAMVLFGIRQPSEDEPEDEPEDDLEDEPEDDLEDEPEDEDFQTDSQQAMTAEADSSSEKMEAPSGATPPTGVFFL